MIVLEEVKSVIVWGDNEPTENQYRNQGYRIVRFVSGKFNLKQAIDTIIKEKI